jgi:hypothetical protein
MAVQGGIYWYEPVSSLLATWLHYEKPQNGTYWFVLPPVRVIPRSVCTGMDWYVLPCTCMVQGGTRWYKVVTGGRRQYKQQYLVVHGGTWQYKNRSIICTGTYWNVLILMVQSGYAVFLLDLLLQFCTA